MRAQGKKETEVLLTRVTSCLPSSTPTKHVYVLWSLVTSLEPCEDDHGGILITQKRKGKGLERAYTESPRLYSLELSFQLDSYRFLGF